jgi:nitroimidazol reductase NimA-like FMN-containing flavoprotein (pyridoxamine 5'-phosphate oxidase superfamily)
MGRYDLEYPKQTENKVNRHDERASYALRTIHGLINNSHFINVSFNPPGSPFPMILPMIGQMGSFDRPSADEGDPLDLYVHGYVSSRVMNTSRRSSSDAPGLPVCVSTSHVDGLILALSAFNHDYNFRSVVLFGHAAIVEDPQEKLYAMELITNSVVPDRWRHTRLPINGAEMQSTSILKVKIASGSAKIRVGGASEQKIDLEDPAIAAGTWTGVLPVYQSIGEPVPSAINRIDVPPYIKEYIGDFNADNKQNSVDVVTKDQDKI